MNKNTKKDWSIWTREAKRDMIILYAIVVLTVGGLVASALQGCNPTKPTTDKKKPKFEIKIPSSITQKALELFQNQK